MKKHLVFYFGIILFYLAGTFVSAGFEPNDYGCSEGIDSGVSDVLETKYSEWSILSNKDLGPDDKIFWNHRHGAQDCIAIVKEAFSPPLENTYVLLLYKREIGRNVFNIVLFDKSNDGWNSKTIYSEKSTATAPVIYLGGPGGYSDFYDRSQITTSESGAIIYQRLESTAFAFIYADGKIIKVLVAD